MIEPGDVTRVIDAQPGVARIALEAADRDALLTVPVARGDYPFPSGRGVVRVIPVEIFDGTRTRVERIVG